MRRNERFSVGDRPRLDVHLPSSPVEVREGPVGSIEVVVDTDRDDNLVVSQVGDTVSVRQDGRWSVRGRSVRLLALVPPRTELDLVTTSGQIRTVGSFGPSRVRTTSGTVDVDGCARLELGTTSGDFRVRQVDGDCTLSTVSGAGVLEHVDGCVTGSSVSGNLRFQRVAGDLRFTTTSGDLRVDCCAGSDVSLKTISGDVALGLPSGIRVDSDLSTVSGRATLPTGEAPPCDEPRRPVRVAVRTVSGDLTIRRAES